MSSANTLNFDSSKILEIGRELSLSQTSPGFYLSAKQVF